MTEYAKLEKTIVDTFDFVRDGTELDQGPDSLEEVRWVQFSAFDNSMTKHSTHKTFESRKDFVYKIVDAPLIEPSKVIQQIKLKDDPRCFNFYIRYEYNPNMPDEYLIRKYRTYIGTCKYGLCPDIELAIKQVGKGGHTNWLDQDCTKPEGL